MTVTEPVLFSSQEVADACGISYRRLDNWVRRGFVSSVQAAQGSGTQRRFEFGEALQVFLTAELARVGVRPGTVLRPDMRRERHPSGGMEDGDTAWVEWDSVVLSQMLRTKLGVDESA